MARFDEVELIREPSGSTIPKLSLIRSDLEPQGTDGADPASRATEPHRHRAAVPRRLLALATDLALFSALGLALSPLLPQRAGLLESIADGWMAFLSLSSFLLLLSWYYFAGCWLIWGRTIGGTIFETRVIEETGAPLRLGSASRRWAWTLVSVASGGAGFLLGVLPGGRTLADRMSRSVVIES